MKSLLILASAVLALVGVACQVDEGAGTGGPTGGTGGSSGATSDASTGDDSGGGGGGGGGDRTNGTGGAVAGTGGEDAAIPPDVSDAGGSVASICDGTGTRLLTADK